MDHMHFLQELIVSEGVAKVFPQDFPCAICQALAMPLAEPGMSQADIMRSVFTLATVGGEVLAIAHLMNSCCKWLLAIMGGVPGATPMVQIEPEEFNFDGNPHNN